jgi:hypothetical protein
MFQQALVNINIFYLLFIDVHRPNPAPFGGISDF